jgi:hypothetical protein
LNTRYGILFQQNSREEVISFTDIKHVHRDLEQFCRLPRSEVMSYFVKICQGKRRGKVTVLTTPEKTLEITYRKRQSDVTVT